MRIENYSAEELFDQLNDIDETQAVEAKALSQDSTRSLRPILYKLVSPNGPLYYTHPEMIHHPRQAFTAKTPGVNKTVMDAQHEPTQGGLLSHETINETIKSNPGIGLLRLSAVIGKSLATVARAVAALVAEGLIEHRGSKKTGGYYLVEKAVAETTAHPHCDCKEGLG